MIATISLYEPKEEVLKTVTKRGAKKTFKYVIEIGAFVFIKPSEESACNFLAKKGFVLSSDFTHYYHKYKSDDQLNLENNYIKR
jgi:hypothetical protein